MGKSETPDRGVTQGCLGTTQRPLFAIHDSEMGGGGTPTSRGTKGRPRKALAVSTLPLRMDGAGPLVYKDREGHFTLIYKVFQRCLKWTPEHVGVLWAL